MTIFLCMRPVLAPPSLCMCVRELNCCCCSRVDTTDGWTDIQTHTSTDYPCGTAECLNTNVASPFSTSLQGQWVKTNYSSSSPWRYNSNVPRAVCECDIHFYLTLHYFYLMCICGKKNCKLSSHSLSHVFLYNGTRWCASTQSGGKSKHSPTW